MNRVLQGLKAYLTDWKNLLTHSIVGVIILAIALFAPVSPYLRLVFIAAVVGFNVVRMKYSRIKRYTHFEMIKNLRGDSVDKFRMPWKKCLK